jgi:lysophospholipase L1-like esterase
MKTILAYGDSLTWGMNAQTLRRHAHEDLWPSVLEQRLGGAARVINAGLGGRTTMFDDHAVSADRNGARILPTVLATFDPIDLVILMLGTNDLKTFINGTAVGAAQGMKRLVEIVRSFPYEGNPPPPQVLIVAPPAVEALGPTAAFPLLSPRSSEGANLATAYAIVATSTGASFFDSAPIASARGGGDGVHLDAANTRAIGEGLAPVVAGLLGITLTRAA